MTMDGEDNQSNNKLKGPTPPIRVSLAEKMKADEGDEVRVPAEDKERI